MTLYRSELNILTIGIFFGALVYRVFCLRLLLLLCAFKSYIVSASEVDQPIVCGQLGGQLGNQLFIVAATLAYAWDYNAYPMFPVLHEELAALSYNKDRIFFRLDANTPSRPVPNKFQESSWNSDTRIPFKPDQVLWGCFQSWIHFHHHRSKILEIFAPHQSDIDYLNEKYASLVSHPNTVAVHVRTYNKNTHDAGLIFLGMDYYKKAFRKFSKNALFVIFSDRINWCRHHFAKFKQRMVFIDGNDHVQDLILMSKMKHNIIGNSTYSWWGAYLNQNSGRVIVPRDWTNPRMYKWPKKWPNHFYLPNWEPIEYDTKAPFPHDIRAYDAVSKSFDKQ